MGTKKGFRWSQEILRTYFFFNGAWALLELPFYYGIPICVICFFVIFIIENNKTEITQVACPAEKN